MKKKIKNIKPLRLPKVSDLISQMVSVQLLPTVEPLSEKGTLLLSRISIELEKNGLPRIDAKTWPRIDKCVFYTSREIGYLLLERLAPLDDLGIRLCDDCHEYLVGTVEQAGDGDINIKISTDLKFQLPSKSKEGKV